MNIPEKMACRYWLEFTKHYGLCDTGEIHRQPNPGNLHEEKALTFECSHIFLRDHKTNCLGNYLCARPGISSLRG